MSIDRARETTRPECTSAWDESADRQGHSMRGILGTNPTRLWHFLATTARRSQFLAPRGLSAAAGPYRAGLKWPVRPSPAWRRVSAHSGDGPMARTTMPTCSSTAPSTPIPPLGQTGHLSVPCPAPVLNLSPNRRTARGRRLSP